MANNLLDALKKAGLADAKKAKKAEHEKKQQQHRDLKRGEVKAESKSVVPAAESVKTQAAVDSAAHQKERLAQAYRGASLSDISGRKKFYFQTLDQHIDCMMLSDVATALLERGKYAIVANENLDDYILVRRASALSIEAIDKKRIIVMRRQEG